MSLGDKTPTITIGTNKNHKENPTGSPSLKGSSRMKQRLIRMGGVSDPCFGLRFFSGLVALMPWAVSMDVRDRVWFQMTGGWQMDGDLVGFLPSEKCYEIKAFAKTKNGQKVVQLGLHRVFFQLFFRWKKVVTGPTSLGPSRQDIPIT